MTYSVAVSDAYGPHRTVSGGLEDFSKACREALNWAIKLSADPEVCRGTKTQEVNIIDGFGYVELSIILPITAPTRHSHRDSA